VADLWVGHRILVARVVVACCLSFAGCGGFLHPATDGGVWLRGRVTDVRPPATCTLGLYRENGALARETTVAPEFDRSLTIAPGQHSYYIEVSCTGKSGKFRSQVYKLGGMRTVDLGTIVLKP
jgi:hypothetical protein